MNYLFIGNNSYSYLSQFGNADFVVPLFKAILKEQILLETQIQIDTIKL